MTFARVIPPVPTSMADWSPWCTLISRTLNSVLAGKMNVNTANFSLTPSVASSTLIDSRIGTTSWIKPMALTANAAAELGAGTMWVSAQQSGQCTITHANNAQADRTFRFVILGG